MATVVNPWITVQGLRKGVQVQRAFAGLEPRVGLPDEQGNSFVEKCPIFYYEREIYPDNSGPIKTELKSYELKDLAITINDLEGWYMDPRAVLTQFITNLGYPGIINPARTTLADILALPLNAEEGYPLHRDTRVKIFGTPPEQ